MGLGVGVVNAKVTAIDPEKLKEWLEDIPEIARQREPANVLALVFFVEMLKEDRKDGGVNSNA